jgi:hypothetical protein
MKGPNTFLDLLGTEHYKYSTVVTVHDMGLLYEHGQEFLNCEIFTVRFVLVTANVECVVASKAIIPSSSSA